MNFIKFNTESPEYDQALKLRQQILRAPLGLDINLEDLNLEKEQLHFGLLTDKQLIACITAIPLNKNKAKIRQMAVSENSQGKGLGSKLLHSASEILREKGFSEIELNARKSAVGFYKKYGFEICGEEFIEVKIPHYKMRKSL